jgi:hypothetical protein
MIMTELDFILSDQFIDFSGKIKEIHEAKKAKQVEFKTLYEKFQADCLALDNQAKGLQIEFEGWKDGQAKATSPKAPAK